MPENEAAHNKYFFNEEKALKNEQVHYTISTKVYLLSGQKSGNAQHTLARSLDLRRVGGVYVSLEAMETLAASEEKVRRLRADAAAAAKQRIAEARESGERLIEEAIRKSAEEIRELDRQSDEKAKAEALELVGSNENRKAVMRARAESRAEQAVALIVERIVNS